MKAKCSSCGAEHVLKDAEIARHNKVQFNCSKCGKPTVIEVKAKPDSTIVMSPLPSFARTGLESAGTSLGMPETGAPLPDGVSASLSVMAGPDKGLEKKIEKGTVIIGRQGADIALNDPEISRQHCLLEVKESYINLKDLDSTNGTFFEDERARAGMLVDGGEFRIGTSVIRVNFAKKA